MEQEEEKQAAACRWHDKKSAFELPSIPLDQMPSLASERVSQAGSLPTLMMGALELNGRSELQRCSQPTRLW